MKTEAEWKKQLTPIEYDVTRNEGAESPFTGKYWDNHERGVYKCVDCGQEVFTSQTKFESGKAGLAFTSRHQLKMLVKPQTISLE